MAQEPRVEISRLAYVDWRKQAAEKVADTRGRTEPASHGGSAEHVYAGLPLGHRYGVQLGESDVAP